MEFLLLKFKKHGKMQLKKILDYTKEIYVKGDILYIKVSNPILKQEILYSRQKVINLINEELEKDLIKKIVLK